MMRRDPIDVVVRVLSIELKVSEEHVRSARSLRDELGMDSIAAANILFALEEEYDRELAVDGVKRLDTVADIARVLEGIPGGFGH